MNVSGRGGGSNHGYIGGGSLKSKHGDTGSVLNHQISPRDGTYHPQLYEDDWTIFWKTAPNQEGQKECTHGYDGRLALGHGSNRMDTSIERHAQPMETTNDG